MAEHDVVVVAYARTPFGRFEGQLAPLDGPTLGALVMDETLRRSGVAAQDVDAVYGGVGMIGSAMLTPVRQAVLRSVLPETTPSATIDRACCSGMTALGFAFKELRLNEARVVMAGGFESLSRTPLLLPRQRAQRIGQLLADDPLLLRGTVVDQPISVYSGEEALRRGVTREQQDQWALHSHQRAGQAEAEGYFDAERFAVDVPQPRGAALHMMRDESPRPDTTLEKLARLIPVYGGKTVTAGNAPGLNDGAAFLMLCQRAYAQTHGLPVLGRIIDYAQVCGGPTSGTSTPATAIRKIAQRQGRGVADWDLLEINEAYAATPLVSTLTLADGDAAAAARLRQRTNTHGGAVALGHPLGASGARIVMTLINGLARRGGGDGVAAICGGFGQGDALMVRVG